MNTVPDDGAENAANEVVETDARNTNETPAVEATPLATQLDASPLPASNASSVDDVVPLSSQPTVRPAKRSLWSTRVSLLLVAALVGGLAGWYASSSKSGPGGVTIDEITNPPGASYLPGGISI